MLKLLEDLNGHIVSMVNTGKLASAQIQHENKAKEYAERLLKGVASVFR
jgi:ArsR family metal-binding transcriptional regulator